MASPLAKISLGSPLIKEVSFSASPFTSLLGPTLKANNLTQGSLCQAVMHCILALRTYHLYLHQRDSKAAVAPMTPVR